MLHEAAVLHELTYNHDQDGCGGASTDEEEDVCNVCDESDDPDPSLAMNHLRALVHTLGREDMGSAESVTSGVTSSLCPVGVVGAVVGASTSSTSHG